MQYAKFIAPLYNFVRQLAVDIILYICEGAWEKGPSYGSFQIFDFILCIVVAICIIKSKIFFEL